MLGKLALGVCVLGAAVAVACGGGSDDGSGFNGSSGGASSSSGSSGDLSSGGFGGSSSGGGDASAQADECKKMDIVFGVDNSGSMEEEQDNLAKNFPAFINVINDYKTKGGSSLDYRVAVTTSDMSKEKGAFTKDKGAGVKGTCLPGPDRRWLERTDGTVADFFACRARAGTNGSNIERTIESIFQGVTGRITDNTNVSNGTSFLRDDALLAFIVLTDEDEGGTEDEPARDVKDYPALFDGVKKERGRWAAAVIAGPGPKKCTSANGDAQFAERDSQFIKDVGANGVFASICQDDLTGALKTALATFTKACENFPGGVN